MSSFSLLFYQKLFSFVGQTTTEYALKHRSVQRFLHTNNQQYDLILVEEFYQDAFLMLSHQFRAPIVSICKLTDKLNIITDFMSVISQQHSAGTLTLTRCSVLSVLGLMFRTRTWISPTLWRSGSVCKTCSSACASSICDIFSICRGSKRWPISILPICQVSQAYNHIKSQMENFTHSIWSVQNHVLPSKNSVDRFQWFYRILMLRWPLSNHKYLELWTSVEST